MSSHHDREEKRLRAAIAPLLRRARRKIQEEDDEAHEVMKEFGYQHLDDYLADPKRSDLEKAFFLLLERFPGSTDLYFVHPNEMVLVPNAYGYGPPIEYEIDFAVYAGTKTRPIKIAIESDGLRSHRRRHSEKDRKKDVNLQAAGWIVMRFGSHEVYEELRRFIDEDAIPQVLTAIDRIIGGVGDLLMPNDVSINEVRSRLTGYEWDSAVCPKCNNHQLHQMGRTARCRKCGHRFPTSSKDGGLEASIDWNCRRRRQGGKAE